MNFKSKVLLVLFLLAGIFPVYKFVNTINTKNSFDSDIKTHVDTDSVGSNLAGQLKEGQDPDSTQKDYIQDDSASDKGSQASSSESETPVSSEEVAYDSTLPQPEQTQEEIKEETSDKGQIEQEYKEIQEEAKKNSTIANVAKVLDKIVKKTFKNKEVLTLGDIANSLFSVRKEKSEIEQFLDKVALKNIIVKKVDKALRVKGVALINKSPLNVQIEVGKKDGKWYGIFYVKSPANFKLSSYIPEILEINKIIPGMPSNLLNTDMMEFEQSYLYISTVEMESYKKLGKIIQGAGFNGKFKFTGHLSDLQKPFGGKAIEFAGKINIPKFEGSKVELRYPQEFNLGQIVGLLIDNKIFKNSDFEKYLSNYAIKKSIVSYANKGLKFKSTIKVNQKNLKTTLDLAKTEDKKWYALFAIESPDKWKVSELLPDLAGYLDVSKIFPGIAKDLLATLPKDIFEFEKSFLYVSTADIKEYKRKVIPEKEEKEESITDTQTDESSDTNTGKSSESSQKVKKEEITVNIVKGVGFSGKAKPIGYINFMNDLFGLGDKALDVKGNIKLPKFTDSDFEIKVPTTKSIIPESIKVNNVDVKLIPGFKVDLTQYEFSIKFVKGLPEFKGVGGVKIYLPKEIEEKPIELASSFEFENKKDEKDKSKDITKLVIKGTQKSTITNLFGLKGLGIEDCEVKIGWDAKTFKPIPEILTITGKMKSGKSELKLESSIEYKKEDKKDEKNKDKEAKKEQEKKKKENPLKAKIEASGKLDLKDLAEFWLNVIVKDKKISDAVMKIVPAITFEDASIIASWGDKETGDDSDSKDKKEEPSLIASNLKFELKVDKANIKLGEFIKLLTQATQKNDVEEFLNKYAITKFSADYYKEGLRLKSSFLINNKPMSIYLEACKDLFLTESEKKQLEKEKEEEKKEAEEREKKEAASKGKKTTADKTKKEAVKKEEKKKESSVKKTKTWYALFYISSPESWLLSDYFPDFLTPSKLFPQASENDKKFLDQFKDIFEFDKSYFYVSTQDIKGHELVGDVVQGVGFNGKAKPIGIFEFFDKIFGLKGEYLELTGAIKIPKFLQGSNFSIKIPTGANIIYETGFFEGSPINIKTPKLIPGTRIDLAPCDLSIVTTDALPYVKLKTYGSIDVKTPLLKETLRFGLGLDFSGQRLKLYGDQQNTIGDIFGVKGLDLAGGKIGLIWDLGVTKPIGDALASVTFGIGELAAGIPVGIIYEGGISATTKDKKGVKEDFVNSSLKLKLDASIHSTNAIDITYFSNGTLRTKDFAEFWINVFEKDLKIPQKQKTDFLNQIPQLIFEDVKIDGAWAEGKKKSIELGAGKVELIPDLWAKMNLKVSEDGISGSGSTAAIYLPNKKDPKIKLLKTGSETDGPSFEVDVTISPVKVELKSDARLWADLGPVLGKIDTGTKLDVTGDAGIVLDSKTKLFGIDSAIKLNGKLDKKIDLESIGFEASFDVNNEEFNKTLKTANKELTEANKKILKEKETKVKNMTNDSQKKVLKDIDNAKNKATQDVDKFFKDSKNAAGYAEGVLWSEIQSWTTICGKKPWYEKGWCDLFQVVTRKVALEAVKLYKNIGANILNDFAKAGIKAVSDVGQFFVALGPDMKKNFELLNVSIADIFTKAGSDITKAIDDLSKSFAINSLKLEGSVSDIKDGKFPKVEYDATAFGRRSKQEVQLDIKNPTEFIGKVSTEITKTALAAVTGKIDEAEKQANDKLSAEEKKASDAIKNAETKASGLKK